MIITRTPFRVSFVGGGSDLPGFYRKNGFGAVLSASIRQYMYIAIHPYFQDKIRIKYSRVEDVDNVEDIQHPIVRECLKRVGIEKGIEIASFADVAAGTGLGSSSSFTVGMLHALYAYQGIRISPLQLAAEACEIEIDILGEPIGKQDQYGAACGGMNVIRFNDDESVETIPLSIARRTVERLESRLRLYYMGGTRSASIILADQTAQVNADEGKFQNLRRMVDLVPALQNDLLQNNGLGIGEILHTGWTMKRELAGGISNSGIDELYARARGLGATGGKLLGAGGAGFLLLDHPDHAALETELGLRTLPFLIDFEGTKLQRFE